MGENSAELLIVSGLSGAGKSIVLDMLEDLDFYCIDNLPLSLLSTLHPRALAKTDPRCRHLAIGVDARTDGHIDQLPRLIETLADAYPNFRTRVIFIQADKDVLLRRFAETRRKHPLSNSNMSLSDALDKEKELLTPLARQANITIDTSHTNLHELRERVRHVLTENAGHQLLLQLQSFGFKYGVPDGVDLVFDARCLPNPHWHPELRPYNGTQAPVAEWLAQQPEVIAMRDDIAAFIERWLPAYQAQDRNYLTVAIGCTGGQHRSVFLVEQLAKILNHSGRQVLLRHTEIR